MDIDALTEVVERLAERIHRVEATLRPASSGSDPALVKRLLSEFEASSTGERLPATVVYAGVGPWQGGTVAWQIGRHWEDTVASADDAVARALAALANGTRLRIVAKLLSGAQSTGDLAMRLDQPSSGQLYHHLKELIAAGVIHQPERGTYAIRKQHAVPLLAVLSAASDLVGPTEEDTAT